MVDGVEWGFYGRARELQELREILERDRWFFARITGRRRIGKTTLVQQALRARPDRRVFYVQVPDSAPAGVLSAVRDAMDTFDVPPESHPRPDSLLAAHADRDPMRLLHLWSLFEGVPKFYRDAFEQGVLGADRRTRTSRRTSASSVPRPRNRSVGT